MDSKSKKTINAAVWYIISSFLSKALLYICTPLFTRLLSTIEYGEYNNFLSWQNILIPLLTFDLSASVGIAYYDYEKENQFNDFLKTVIVSSYIIPGFFCMIIYFAKEYFSSLFLIKQEYLSILLVYITFNNTINIFQAEQRVRLKYKVSALLTLVTSLLTVLATLVMAIVFHDRLKGVLWGGVVVNTIVSFLLAIRILFDTHRIKKEYLKYALLVTVPLIPHVLSGTILGSADKVMITKYCGEKYTALYGLVYTISMFITMLASSINKAWTPWFFDRIKYNKFDYIKPVSKIIFSSIVIVAVLICLLAPEVLLIIGGKDYVCAVNIMPPIVAACVINCVSTFYINIEFYNKKTFGISIATVLSASLNVILNLLFIKRFGYVAAAYTTLLSSCLSLVFHIYKVKKQGMIDIFDNKYMVSIVFAFLLMSVVFIYIYRQTFIRVIMMFACFCLSLMLLFKNKAQILWLYNTIRKKDDSN